MACEVVDAEIGKELRSVVERLVALEVDFRSALEEWRREWLLAELKRAQGNQCVAARRMGVHRNTVGLELRRAGLAGNRRKSHKARVLAFAQTTLDSPTVSPPVRPAPVQNGGSKEVDTKRVS